MGLGIDAGLDAIHVTAYGEPMVATGITDGHTPHEPGALLADAGRVRRELGVPVIAMGRLTPEAAEQALADGAADVIAMGRPLIADPDLPHKLAAGQRHRIRPCTYQYRCIGAIFLNAAGAVRGEPGGRPRGRAAAAAGRPAAAGRWWRAAARPGSSAPRRLAERGHHVELWEASDRLGGRLALAEQADPDLAGLLAWLVGRRRGRRRGDPHWTRRSTGAVDADVLVWAVGATGRWRSLGVDDLRGWLDGTEPLGEPARRCAAAARRPCRSRCAPATTATTSPSCPTTRCSPPSSASPAASASSPPPSGPGS